MVKFKPARAQMTATNLMARLHIKHCYVLITSQLGNKYIVVYHQHQSFRSNNPKPWEIN